jgi:CheY-like chemotaxis protein
MIVDDEPENLDVLGTMLSEAGWAVRVFPQGELALAAAREEPPALVLLDVRMPGMDGYDLCRCFKEDARLCQIPILFASGCATKALGFPLPISSGFARNSGCLSSQWEHPILPLVWAESTTITMRSNSGYDYEPRMHRAQMNRIIRQFILLWSIGVGLMDTSAKSPKHALRLALHARLRRIVAALLVAGAGRGAREVKKNRVRREEFPSQPPPQLPSLIPLASPSRL